MRLMSVSVRIRSYRASDREALYRVCLMTGDAGADGTAAFGAAPEALGHLYVGPYLELEGERALVLEDPAGPCGYCLGALDSRVFYQRMEEEWLPQWRSNFPEPSGERTAWTPLQRLFYEMHHFTYFLPDPYEVYPSHLHIDLLPRVQGQGWGKQLMKTLMDRLSRDGSPGVHLGMAETNVRAAQFYQKLGFQDLATVDGTRYLGRRLDPNRKRGDSVESGPAGTRNI